MIKKKLNNGLARRSHAPADLRADFKEAVCVWAHEKTRAWPMKRLIDVDGGVVDLKRMRSMLWNCTDIMPGHLCDDLDLSRGSTYARGVRGLRILGVTDSWTTKLGG